MSNRTSCFSLKNYNNSCCLAEAIEIKYKTHLSATIVSSIVFIVLFPVAIVANSLIFVAIWKGRSERTWFHIILGVLAFCDFVQDFLSNHSWVLAHCSSLSIQLHHQIKNT